MTRDLSDVVLCDAAARVLDFLRKGINPSFTSVEDKEDWKRVEQASDVDQVNGAALLIDMDDWITRTEHKGNTFSFYANEQTKQFLFGSATEHRGRPIIVVNDIPETWLILNADMRPGPEAVNVPDGTLLGGAMYGRINISN